jgi:glucan 1,3-beta-glucosidase
MFFTAFIQRLMELSQTTGAQAIIDAEVSNTPIFIRTSKASNGKFAGSVLLNNVKLKNVPVVVGVLNGGTVLPGSTGTMTIAAWAQGNIYHGSIPTPNFVQDFIPAPNKNPSLLGPDGKIVSKSHPQYEDLDVSSFVSARDFGAFGDGVTDDTKALQLILNQVCNNFYRQQKQS